MSRLLLSCLCSLLLAACESGRAPSGAERSAIEQRPAAAPAAAGAQRYGGAFEPSPEVALSDLLKNPTQYTSTVTTTGTVKRACSNKGCWMEIAQADTPACRVTFKDYGFFVPTDSAGARARVQGVLETQRVPAGRVRHLENEGATFAQKNPDGSATEVTLIATAVELVR